MLVVPDRFRRKSYNLSKLELLQIARVDQLGDLPFATRAQVELDCVAQELVHIDLAHSLTVEELQNLLFVFFNIAGRVYCLNLFCKRRWLRG